MFRALSFPYREARLKKEKYAEEKVSLEGSRRWRGTASREVWQCPSETRVRTCQVWRASGDGRKAIAEGHA